MAMTLIHWLYQCFETTLIINFLSMSFFLQKDIDTSTAETTQKGKQELFLFRTTMLAASILFLLGLKIGGSGYSWLLPAILLVVVFGALDTMIYSIGTIGTIISGKRKKELSNQEHLSLLLSALLVILAHTDFISHNLWEFAATQKNQIYSDFLMTIFYAGSVIVLNFFICSLAIRPLNLLARCITWLFRFIHAEKMGQWLENMIDLRTKFIESGKDTAIITVPYRTHVISCFLAKITVAILNIGVRFLARLALILLIALLNLVLLIQSSVASLLGVSRVLLQTSALNITTVSFRISVIIGLGLTVVVNHYEPFLRHSESLSVLEFVSSVIIIPLILEWIISFKKAGNVNENK